MHDLTLFWHLSPVMGGKTLEVRLRKKKELKMGQDLLPKTATGGEIFVPGSAF